MGPSRLLNRTVRTCPNRAQPRCAAHRHVSFVPRAATALWRQIRLCPARAEPSATSPASWPRPALVPLVMPASPPQSSHKPVRLVSTRTRRANRFARCAPLGLSPPPPAGPAVLRARQRHTVALSAPSNAPSAPRAHMRIGRRPPHVQRAPPVATGALVVCRLHCATAYALPASGARLVPSLRSPSRAERNQCTVRPIRLRRKRWIVECSPATQPLSSTPLQP